jgi:hypothetical protein
LQEPSYPPGEESSTVVKEQGDIVLCSTQQRDHRVPLLKDGTSLLHVGSAIKINHLYNYVEAISL